MGLEITTELKAKASAMQKALRLANNALRDANNAEQRLAEAVSALRMLSSAELADAPHDELKQCIVELGISEMYESVSQKLSSLNEMSRKTLKEFESYKPLLKRYLTCSTFAFASKKRAVEFIQRICSLYNITSLRFKPEFLGLLDLDLLARQTGSVKEEKTMLKIPVGSIPRIVESLESAGMARNYIFSTPSMKISCRSPTEICVDASEQRLNRVERLYKEKYAPVSALAGG